MRARTAPCPRWCRASRSEGMHSSRSGLRPQGRPRGSRYGTLRSTRRAARRDRGDLASGRVEQRMRAGADEQRPREDRLYAFERALPRLRLEVAHVRDDDAWRRRGVDGDFASCFGCEPIQIDRRFGLEARSALRDENDCAPSRIGQGGVSGAGKGRLRRPRDRSDLFGDVTLLQQRGNRSPMSEAGTLRKRGSPRQRGVGRSVRRARRGAAADPD